MSMLSSSYDDMSSIIPSVNDDTSGRPDANIYVRYCNLKNKSADTRNTAFCEEIFIDRAKKLLDLGVSCESVIRILVRDYGFGKALLLPNELLNLIKKIDLGGQMVDWMIEKITKDENVSLSPSDEQLEAQSFLSAELSDFLSNPDASLSVEKLVEAFSVQIATFNGLALLNGDLRETMKDKIRNVLNRSVPRVYRVIYEENPKNFIMDFFMGRVMSESSDGKHIFSRAKFIELLTFLDSLNVDLESINHDGDFYSWLLEEAAQFRKFTEVDNMRKGFREEVFSLLSFNDFYLDRSFDIDHFYKRCIKTGINRFKTKKIAKLKRVREPDLLRIAPDDLLNDMDTHEHAKFLRAVCEMKNGSETDFLRWMRVRLGYKWSPEARFLSDKEVKEDISKDMEIASNIIKHGIDEALIFRNGSQDPIHLYCRINPYILDVRDFGLLLDWIASPKKFREYIRQFMYSRKHPLSAYEMGVDLSDAIIRHQCLLMLKIFLFYRDLISEGEVKESLQHRELIEGFLDNALNFSNVVEKKIEFRFIKFLDDIKNQSQQFSAVYSGVPWCINPLDNSFVEECLENEEKDNFVYKGRPCKAYPKETVLFKEVSFNFKYFEFDDNTKKMVEREKAIRVLVYSGDGRLIHSKNISSKVFSRLRGKILSDQNRWCLIFENENDKDCFMNFLYGLGGLGVVKVEDTKEGRFIGKKGQNQFIKTQTTSAFKDTQMFTGAFDILIPAVTQHGIEKKKIRFETHVSTLLQKLTGDISKYSPCSHKKYRSSRAWEIMWRYMFPPRVYGSEYYAEMKKGFDYGMEEDE